MKIVKDQIEERSVVVFILSKESAIWKDASMETLLRGDQLKDTDVEGMRVVINNRCAAEQIKNDKVEHVVTGEIKTGEFCKRQNLLSTVMDGVTCGKVGKSETSNTDEERED